MNEHQKDIDEKASKTFHGSGSSRSDTSHGGDDIEAENGSSNEDSISKEKSIEEPTSRRRYMETRGKQQKGVHSSPDDNDDDEDVPGPPPLNPQNESVVTPGAVRVAGPGIDIDHGAQDSGATVEWGQNDNQQQESNMEDDNDARPTTEAEATTLVHAELVTSSDTAKQQQHNVPYADKAIPIRPWKQRVGIVLLVVVVVGVSVGIAVPLARRSSSSPAATLAPSTSFPSLIPTTTPAPTSREHITVVLGLDSKPQETGWRLECEGQNQANFPSGVYDIRSANRNRTEQFPLTVGQECVFTIMDSAGDGLELGGFFRLHYGLVYASATSETVLAAGNGNFTSSKQADFVMVLPLTSAPSSAVTLAPSTPTDPFFPTLRPTRDRPTPAPVIFEPPIQTTGPTNIATLKPVSDPPPTPDETVKLTIIIQEDEYPSETSWSVTCDDEVLKKVDPMTYGEPNQLVTEVLTTTVGASCTFVIEDSFGDGICCVFEPFGFYRLYFGEDTNDSNNLISEGGRFRMSEEVMFTAREPL